MSSTQDQTEQAMVNMLAKHVLPLFNQLLESQERLENKMNYLENKVDRIDENLQDFKEEMRDFKDRQLSFNDWVAKKIETLEIEYRTICYQLEEYDNFFHDSSIPEEEKKSAYKVLVLKVTTLESEIKIIKKQLQIA